MNSAKKDILSHIHRKIFILPIVILFQLIMANESFSWNARDHTDYDLDGNYDTIKAHNFIIEEAVQWLEDNGKLPFHSKEKVVSSYCDANCESSIAIDYLAYGAWWADHVWGGIPEHPDWRVSGINDWIFRGDPKRYDRESYFPPAFYTPPWALCYSDLHVETSYSKWYKGDEVNTIFRATNSILFNIELEEFAGDNYFHYSLNKGHIKFASMPVIPGALWNLNGSTAFRNASENLGAASYGTTLYQIAQDFWLGNADRKPSTSRFRKFHRSMTGEIHLKNACAFFSDRRSLEAKFPTFYQGANPFICEAKGDDDDWCESGKPTWPVWVPPYEQVAFEDDSSEKQVVFHDQLLEESPKKSKRAAFLYLGWALHMLGDVAVPDHVRSKTGLSHPMMENSADIALENFKRDDFPSFDFGGNDSEFANIQEKSFEKMCEDFGLPAGGDEQDIEIIFQDLEDFSRPYYQNLFMDANPVQTIRGDVAEILNEAVKQAIKLVACIGVCGLYITDEEMYGKLTYTGCFIEAGPSVVVEDEADVKFVANDYIKLLPGFHAQRGSLFSANIEE